MEKAASKIERSARAGWPVSRNQQGNPRKKKHSVDFFDARTRLFPDRIVVSVFNTSEYGYFIKSVMVGETRGEQRKRHTLQKGESLARYEARRRLGRKRHAFSVLMRKPGRKAGRLLVRELQNDLIDLLQKELT